MQIANQLKFKLLALTLALLPVILPAQNKQVRGVVTDDEGPLIGASVVIKGTTSGTATDLDGHYSISVPSDDAVLVFSCIGYKTVERIVGSSRDIDVRLSIDDNLLEDVVVVGYGTQAKSHLTGSISKIEGDGALIDIPVSDVTTALQGQVAGLTVNNNTSEVGVVPTIRVRGTGSISADSSPLVIVDGYPVPDGLSTVNASDIQSIEILKDAADLAVRNTVLNQLTEIISVIHADAGEVHHFIKPCSIDAVVCNPPYGQPASSLTSPIASIASARTQETDTLDRFFTGAFRILKGKGRLFLVYPATQMLHVMKRLQSHHLEPKRFRLVYPYADKPPNIVLIEALKDARPTLQPLPPLIVYEKDGTLTNELKFVYHIEEQTKV